ncbi:RNA-directed DNA polymerase [Vigna unguiculata]|uniref:RNA-directed DNA polymerase n=1 Tax=Vigna unguiculata TaxID=3917 RepID=A0A4D6KWX0_VIGUN|nr:RNA-directed DNA polymerase [Vigna unguiculata]
MPKGVLGLGAKDATLQKASEYKDYTAEKAKEGKDTATGKVGELKDSAADAAKRAMGYFSGTRDETKVSGTTRSCAHATGTFPLRNAVGTPVLHSLLSLRNAVIRNRFEWNNKTNPLLRAPNDITLSKPLSKRRLQAAIKSDASCFQDRVVQEVLLMILEPVFEPRFSPKSHAFRPGRNAHTVIRTIRSNFAGYLWFLKGDLSEILNHVDPEVVMCSLEKGTRDNKILARW